MKTVLSIAGFDPSSGAGITADLFVFAAHRLFGTACITSLTIQSTTGVRRSKPVETEIIAETLACLDEDLPAAGIKIGMLGAKSAIEAVASFLERRQQRCFDIPVVVDPVLRSSSGRQLLDAAGVESLKSRLLPLTDWVTPNLHELAYLTGRSGLARDELPQSSFELQDALRTFSSKRINVFAKGGHLIPPDDFLLTESQSRHWLPGNLVETNSTHGTGCALSSALLCRLVLGDDPLTAARNAKAYVAEALRRSTPVGHGNGPMNHLWPLRNG